MIRDRLAVVDGGTSAHSQNQVDFFPSCEVSPFKNLFNVGIGHHSGEFDDPLSCGFNLGDDLVKDAELLDGASSVDEHDRRTVSFQLFAKTGEGLLTEMEFCGIVECEIS